MTEVFLLKEVNLLDSGEISFYVDPYETEDKALSAMKTEIEEHIENNQAFITDGELGDWIVILSDKEGNEYRFEIEKTVVK